MRTLDPFKVVQHYNTYFLVYSLLNIFNITIDLFQFLCVGTLTLYKKAVSLKNIKYIKTIENSIINSHKFSKVQYPLHRVLSYIYYVKKRSGNDLRNKTY